MRISKMICKVKLAVIFFKGREIKIFWLTKVSQILNINCFYVAKDELACKSVGALFQ